MIMIDENVFQFGKFICHAFMIQRILRNPESLRTIVFKKLRDIFENCVVLVIHMIVYFLHIFIIEFEKQKSDVIYICAVDGLNKFPAN